MSRCPVCECDFPESVIACPNDGEVLIAEVRRVEQDATLANTALASTALADATLQLPAVSVAVGAQGGGSVETVALAAGGGGTTQQAGPSDDMLPAGYRIGEYEIVKHLDSGGMGSVFSAVHPVIGKDVAVKVLSRMLSLDSTMVDRFIQEARAVNQIRHHNIVDIFAFGKIHDGRAYCVMELLQGETLKDRLRRGALGYEEAVAILVQVCDGIEAAHKAGIVHRDLKPDNIFLVATSAGQLVKVLDFGIAKLLDSDGAGQRQRTHAGLLIGTPEYMSPEQCTGRDVDTRADIYLLGVTMYEAFTGRLPFSSKTPIQVINAHASERPVDPTQHTDLPRSLADLILACLAKEPADRPQTAGEVREQLLAIVKELGGEIAQHAVPAPSAITDVHTPIRRTRGAVTGAAKRRRVVRLVGVSMVLLLAAIGAIVTVQTLRGDGAKPTAEARPHGSAVAPDTLALQVITTPPGASVTIGGSKQRLRTPYVYQVPSAPKVEVRLELAGHHPVVRELTIADGELERLLELELLPIGTPALPPADAGVAAVTATPSDKPPVMKGAPAIVRDLELGVAIAWLGEKTTVTGTLKFDDPDADVAAIHTAVDGKPAGRSPLNLAGATTGTAALTLVLAPVKAGPHVIEVWIEDRGSNRSNKLSQTIEVMERDKLAPDRAGSDSEAPEE